jgi:CelD/BcsL family acetyltransferase involved in cellulose biosynthesis
MRQQHGHIDDAHFVGRDLVDRPVVTAENKVLDRVAWIAAAILAHHQQGVKEIDVVFLVVNGAEVGRLVATAQRREAVYVMRVPVAEMLDLGVACLDRAEQPLLVLAVLEKMRR